MSISETEVSRGRDVAPLDPSPEPTNGILPTDRTKPTAVDGNRGRADRVHLSEETEDSRGGGLYR